MLDDEPIRTTATTRPESPTTGSRSRGTRFNAPTADQPERDILDLTLESTPPPPAHVSPRPASRTLAVSATTTNSNLRLDVQFLTTRDRNLLNQPTADRRVARPVVPYKSFVSRNDPVQSSSSGSGLSSLRIKQNVQHHYSSVPGSGSPTSAIKAWTVQDQYASSVEQRQQGARSSTNRPSPLPAPPRSSATNSNPPFVPPFRSNPVPLTFDPVETPEICFTDSFNLPLPLPLPVASRHSTQIRNDQVESKNRLQHQHQLNPTLTTGTTAEYNIRNKEEEEEEVVIVNDREMAPVLIQPSDPSKRQQHQSQPQLSSQEQLYQRNMSLRHQHHAQSQGSSSSNWFQQGNQDRNAAIAAGATRQKHGSMSSGRKSKKTVGASGGGGKYGGMYDEDDEEDNQQDVKGKGKAKAKPSRGPAYAFQHAIGSATSDKNGKPNSRPSSTLKQPEIMYANAPATNMEKAGRMVMDSLEKLGQYATGQPFRIGIHQPPAISKETFFAIKGKGSKGKRTMPVEEMTISSDDETGTVRERGDSDPIEDDSQTGDLEENDEIQMTGTTSATNPARPRNPIRQTRDRGSTVLGAVPVDEPGSDPLSMTMESTSSVSTRPNGPVQTKINQFEALAQATRRYGNSEQSPRVSVVGNLQPRKSNRPPPSLDGAGISQGIDNYKPLPTTKLAITTTTKSVPVDRKQNKRSDGSVALDSVLDLAIKPFMLTRSFVSPHDVGDGIEHRLKLTTTGKIKSQKITITRKAPGGEQEDLTSFRCEDVYSIHWQALPEFDRRIAFAIRLHSKGERVLNELCPDYDDSHVGIKNEVVIISEDQLIESDQWQQHPVTILEKILYCFHRWGKNDIKVQEGGESLGVVHPLYVEHVRSAKELASKLLVGGKRPRASTTTINKSSSKPKDTTNSLQMQLSFANQGTIPKNNFYNGGGMRDAQGDYVLETGNTSAAGTPSVRRSSRQSTSLYKEAAPRRSLPAPAADLFPPEHVILEYPINEPGAMSVTYGDKKRLNDEEFLNDTLIEFGLKKAIVEVKRADEQRSDPDKVAPLVHVFNSFFYKKLSSGKQVAEDKAKGIFTPYYLVEKWTKKFNLFDKKYIVIPINEHLHWYLAVIVNPRWIIDAASLYPEVDKSERAPSTRGRTSTANDGTFTVSPEPGTPIAGTADSDQAVIVEEEERKSKYFAGKSTVASPASPVQEDTEVEIEAKHTEQENSIAAKIGELAAKTTMGGEESIPSPIIDEDSDVEMVDPTVEGGGGVPRTETETLSLDDDSIEETQQSPATTVEPTAPEPIPRGVPIGRPTAPPKGASSPVPVPETVELMDIDELDSANDLARQLGADACWVFTFDSLGGKHDAVVEKLKKYLDMEAKTKLGSDWTAAHKVQGISVKVPQQQNYCDCGLYILHFVERFLADPLRMTRHIVGREIRPEPIKGNNEDAKRRRAELAAKKRRFETAVNRENIWNEQVAKDKRKTMRAEVETLMQEFKPIQEARYRKEAEERKAKEKKKEEKDAKEAAKRAAQIEIGDAAAEAEEARKRAEKEKKRQEQEQELAAAAAAAAAAKKGGRRGKKEAETITLADSSDDETDSIAGSPRKPPPASPPPPSVDPSARKVISQPTNDDFLPPSSAPSLNGHGRHTTFASPDPENDESGDLGNTQEHELVAPPAAQRTRRLSVTEGQSPPSKKRKRPVPPDPSPPAPALSSIAVETRPDSSNEVQPRITPEFEQPPPANQQQLASSTATKKASVDLHSRDTGSAETMILDD
ncbi:uncharacterized protein JCM15063_005430 [Sporobolomyces koalae]|uniref:uncharacterized protein n=1 Tax=Sporobolomyces koalae TaxID=500713 RepID=UPI00317EAECD